MGDYWGSNPIQQALIVIVLMVLAIGVGVISALLIFSH